MLWVRKFGSLASLGGGWGRFRVPLTAVRLKTVSFRQIYIISFKWRRFEGLFFCVNKSWMKYILRRAALILSG